MLFKGINSEKEASMKSHSCCCKLLITFIKRTSIVTHEWSSKLLVTIFHMSIPERKCLQFVLLQNLKDEKKNSIILRASKSTAAHVPWKKNILQPTDFRVYQIESYVILTFKHRAHTDCLSTNRVTLNF